MKRLIRSAVGVPFFTYTNPLFWLFLSITLILRGLYWVWKFSTIEDWIFYHTEMNDSSDETLERMVRIAKNKPKYFFLFPHKLFLWKLAKKKAESILIKRAIQNVDLSPTNKPNII